MADQPMTAIIATFDKTEDAEKWLKHAGADDIKVHEGIVLTRDAETGKIHKHLANLPGVAAGAGVGALAGILLGVLFPPALLGEALAAAIIGAGGAIVGGGAVAVKDELMDRGAFDEVADALKPGQSALVVVLDSDAAEAYDKELSGYDRKWVEELPVGD